MHERTPEEETTSRLALTALTLAHAGATAQEILAAITTDCENAGLTLAQQQRGLIVKHALFSARKEHGGRRAPTTTPDAPAVTPTSDPPVVTSTTQARDSQDWSGGIPIVPETIRVDEPPLGHTGTTAVPKDGDYHIETIARPFTQVPNALYALPRTQKLTLPAQALLTQICRRTYGYHRYLSHPVSKKELAEDCNMTEPSVVKAMRELETKGIIQRLQQKDRRGLKAKNMIRITVHEHQRDGNDVTILPEEPRHIATPRRW